MCQANKIDNKCNVTLQCKKSSFNMPESIRGIIQDTPESRRVTSDNYRNYKVIRQGFEH